MDYLANVQAGVDFIEKHLDEDIALAAVARAAGISQWHFQRIFKALTNETLKTYIRSRRLANSLDKLLHTERRILDISLDAGFQSQEAFTRAFKKAFGLTPDRYRKMGDRSLFLRKVQFDEEYLRHINRNVSLEPEIYEQPPMALVGLKTSFYGIDSDKNNIGETLPQLWVTFMEQLAAHRVAVSGNCYGVVVQCADDGERLAYHAAIPAEAWQANPTGMSSIVVPGGTYARFAHRGHPRDVDRTVNYVYSTWLSSSGYRHTYAADLEIYGDAYAADSESSVFHYAIPIER